MASDSTAYGMALRNFVTYPDLPDPNDLIKQAVWIEELGFESVWVWDHILLGVEPHFPIIDALSLLTAVAARTNQVKLGTGILILPLRNPVLLAKQLASIDLISNGRLLPGLASGWYKREFDACGVDFHRRGKIMDESLEILERLWTEEKTTAEYSPYNLRSAVMYPKPAQQPRPPILIGGYAERVLRRVASKSDGWLTYCYTAASYAGDKKRILAFAEEGGRDPSTLSFTNQLPIAIGPRDKIEGPMKEWLDTEWDFAAGSKSTADSAIIGTVEECAEQIQAHLDEGLDRLVFMPYRYQDDQVEAIATQLIPLLT
ncbi:MAG TPA: TIGR03619 family F420-dependent LLM class oxidoreductase [Gammaproteobacteria bacterium]|nr:TIGR03619 family F420-dependent LLM class oxidoreductase [Gammaproteobacteria bacterium]HIL18182.1 TIGR03619 family F420-dependent LLM class oxidoreductase [Gammaproteobacteria bacterium]